MRLNEINIRDPYILPENGIYYLYGTRGATCWGPADGFDVYVSRDLEHWEGPRECFHSGDGFWADRDFWAPEVHPFRGGTYMLASFKGPDRPRGTAILRADSPLGPFAPWSAGPVTPRNWACLDGTLFVDGAGLPWMVFCHEWVQCGDGEVCALPLTEDLRAAAGAPRVLFRASEAPWSQRKRHSSGVEGHVTDGPFMWRLADGRLLCLWAGFSEAGYCEAQAVSEGGDPRRSLAAAGAAVSGRRRPRHGVPGLRRRAAADAPHPQHPSAGASRPVPRGGAGRAACQRGGRDMIRFECDDAALQRLYDTAEARCRLNLKDFGGDRVLVEGGGYEKIWLETQPMGGEMYALRDMEAAKNNSALFMRCQRADGRLPGSIQCVDGGIEPQFNKLQGFCFPDPALNLYYLLGRDPHWLDALRDCLAGFDGWLWRTRDVSGDGLLSAFCVYDTGEDNAVRYGDAPCWWTDDAPPEGYSVVPMASMDVTSYSYACRETLQRISLMQGRPDEAPSRGPKRPRRWPTRSESACGTRPGARCMTGTGGAKPWTCSATTPCAACTGAACRPRWRRASSGSTC